MMQMVEILRTNVQNEVAASYLVGMIQLQLPDQRVNFDLKDCDRILRIQATFPRWEAIIRLLEKEGFHAELLPDEVPVPVLKWPA